jgi:hypothetical protein
MDEIVSDNMIKGNFDVKKIEDEPISEDDELEQLVARAGVGSHMIFRTDKKDDELFIDEL